MRDGEEPVEHWTISEPVDLVARLERAGVEHLDVDESRVIVNKT